MVRSQEAEGDQMDSVRVFNGGGHFPAVIFSSRDLAEVWIARHRLIGVLTKYLLDVGLYDWAIGCGAFRPKRPDQSEPRFIGQFSSASLEHYHLTGDSDAQPAGEAEQGGD